MKNDTCFKSEPCEGSAMERAKKSVEAGQELAKVLTQEPTQQLQIQTLGEFPWEGCSREDP